MPAYIILISTSSWPTFFYWVHHSVELVAKDWPQMWQKKNQTWKSAKLFSSKKTKKQKKTIFCWKYDRIRVSTLSGRQQSKHSVQAIELNTILYWPRGKNLVGASSSLLDIYTKYRHMPEVGASPLMTKYDNEGDVFLPGHSLVLAPPVPDQIGSAWFLITTLLDRILQQAIQQKHYIILT